MTTRTNTSTTALTMPSGNILDTKRPRSAGTLSSEELAFCRANHIAVAYDPLQIGWVLGSVDDDIDPSTHVNRIVRPKRKATSRTNAGLKKINARDPDYQLRAWQHDDLDKFLELLDDPAVWKWLPEAYPDPLTAEVGASLIELSSASNHHQVYAVLRNGDIVGQVRLEYHVNPTDPSVAEVSYWLGQKYWGKGIGSELVKMFTSHAFENNPDIGSIVARVHKENFGSRRVLEKADYTFEGHDTENPVWSIMRNFRD